MNTSTMNIEIYPSYEFSGHTHFYYAIVSDNAPRQ
jgi:hypothetical protein